MKYDNETEMKTYTLYEMTVLLKTGLWSGGEVEKLGYLGTAVPCATPAHGCGLTGIAVDHDTMVERCEVSASGAGCKLLISQYRPYAGAYVACIVTSTLSDRQTLLMQLSDTVAGKRDPYSFSHDLYKRNAFSLERRYKGNFSSMRSGEAHMPRKSKFFGR